MKSVQRHSFNSVVLVSTPWPIYNRPSTQIGSLKAYLQSQFPGLAVKAYHIYLKVAQTIGYKLYHEISERTWLAETIYAALLYPERFESIEKLFSRESVKNPDLRTVDFKALIGQVKTASNNFIDNTQWSNFGLAGFSICHCQLTSALYFIKRIKSKRPGLPVVIGGSAFSADTSENLIAAFPEIDFVITGEGELPLSRLVAHLREFPMCKDQPPLSGIVSARTEKDKNFPVTMSQLDDLSRLPIPDYGDYFELLKTFNPRHHFFPTLPVEMSRGCWWAKTSREGKHSGCAFCNLNLQWDGYRVKSNDQVVEEFDHLTTKHKCLSVAVMDNLVPLRQSEDLFGSLSELNKDFDIFCEIRATTPRKVLAEMKRAGVREVQIGIEALSTRLLKKLKKGTTAIQNIEIMKHCEELGLLNLSNLISQFPGSDSEDVAETLRNLEFVLPFRPMRFVHFWLGRGSPAWQNPMAYGIRSVFNHCNWNILFPPQIAKSVEFMIQTYRGDRVRQKKLWQPVKQKLRDWAKTYAELHTASESTPILSFRDGTDFLIIKQKNLKAEPMTHRLVGTSREIYLYCLQHRSLKRILLQFPHLGEEKIRPFLKMMVEKKLVFEENDRYLSLAVPIRR
jgi:ribosomal peptide maturation radical SAM protein 1